MIHGDAETGPMEVNAADFAALQAQIDANQAREDHRIRRRMPTAAGMSYELAGHAIDARSALEEAGLTPDPSETTATTQTIELTPPQRFAIRAGRSVLDAARARQELEQQPIDIWRTLGRVAAFFAPIPHVGYYPRLRDTVVHRPPQP